MSALNADRAKAHRRGYRVTMMHHPGLHVPDLDEAERWIGRVFRRPSIPIATVLSQVAFLQANWPRDYSLYTPISDVFLFTMDPSRFVVQGKQIFPKVEEPRLVDLGFYIAGTTEAFQAMHDYGLHLSNSMGIPIEGDVPTGPNEPTPFFARATELGLAYQFYPATVFPGDPRMEPGWAVPPVLADDPLSIERCSHHTILTHQPQRGIRFLVDVLGARVVHYGRNNLLSTESTCVHLADSTFEFATPGPGTPLHRKWSESAPDDVFHSITWKVHDLERAESHLVAEGVRIASRSHDAIMTDPTTSLGVPWGFSSALLPGDPRHRLDDALIGS